MDNYSRFNQYTSGGFNNWDLQVESASTSNGLRRPPNCGVKHRASCVEQCRFMKFMKFNKILDELAKNRHSQTFWRRESGESHGSQTFKAQRNSKKTLFKQTFRESLLICCWIGNNWALIEEHWRWVGIRWALDCVDGIWYIVPVKTKHLRTKLEPFDVRQEIAALCGCPTSGDSDAFGFSVFNSLLRSIEIGIRGPVKEHTFSFKEFSRIIKPSIADSCSRHLADHLNRSAHKKVLEIIRSFIRNSNLVEALTPTAS